MAIDNNVNSLAIREIVEELLTIDQPSQDRAQIIIVPDEYNNENKDLFFESFSKIAKKEYRQIVIITEQFAPTSLSPGVLVPDFESEIFTQIHPAFESILQLKEDGAEALPNDYPTVDKLNDVLSFVSYLLPETEICPIICHKTSGEKIFRLLSKLRLGSNDLVIVSSTLSLGLTRAEALHMDATILGELLAQDTNIQPQQTPYSNVLNAISLLSYSMKLRTKKYGYKTVSHNGRNLIQVKGLVAFGYFI